MARASYDDAIAWIIEMDDVEWLPDYPVSNISVTACMVRDIFQKTEEQVIDDLKREQRRYDRRLRKEKAAQRG